MKTLNHRRVILIYVMIILCFSLLFFKLYSLSQASISSVMPSLTGQYSRKLDVVSRRGFIFDRSGQIIAGYDDGYVSVIDPSKIKRSVEEICTELSKYSNVEKDELMVKFSEGKPFILKTEYEFAGDYITSFKAYKRNETVNDSGKIPAVHIIGYLNGEGNGVSGIEHEYNDFLKKTSSYVSASYESDAGRKSFGGIPIHIPENDYNKKTGLMLTLDWDLQKKIEEIADVSLPKGAIIVTSVSDGEILASVSRPDFEIGKINEILESTEGEFLNRSFQTFTPGSVFKTVIAAAALEINNEYSDFEYYCKGEINVYGQMFSCYNHVGHGNNNLSGAYAKSCNCYFITLALEIGYDRIYDMAIKMGIGSISSIDKLSTQKGNIPYVQTPPPAFIANISIGQGEILVTPFEIVRIMSCIANNGILPNLSLVRALYFPNSAEKIGNLPGEKILSDETVSILREMTKLCVDSGTGISAKPEKGDAGGKTSSAESGQYIIREKIQNNSVSANNANESEDENKAETEGDFMTEISEERVQIVHSWFAGYYPADNPLFAIAVVAEGGVTFDVKSTTIFKQICDYLALYLY